MVWYSPGNVELRPIILKNSQDYIEKELKTAAKPVSGCGVGGPLAAQRASFSPRPRGRPAQPAQSGAGCGAPPGLFQDGRRLRRARDALGQFFISHAGASLISQKRSMVTVSGLASGACSPNFCRPLGGDQTVEALQFLQITSHTTCSIATVMM